MSTVSVAIVTVQQFNMPNTRGTDKSFPKGLLPAKTINQALCDDCGQTEHCIDDGWRCSAQKVRSHHPRKVEEEARATASSTR